MFQIKLSEGTTARRRIPILLVDATDGYTPETGITTPTIKVSKNGGTQAAGTGTFTEIGTGQYYYEFASGEIDTLGWVTFNLQKAGCRDYNAIVQIMAYDAMDAVRLGLTALPNANAASAGGLLTSGTGSHQINTSAGVVDANAIQISGDATAADNLESAADGTGYNLGGGQIVAASVTGAVGSVTGNVGGNVAGSVNSVTTGVSLATGAITSSAIATGAITSTAFASQAITGTAIQDGAISANKIGTGAITSGKFATGAITADAIAAGAISVSEIADGAITATKFGAGAITSTVVDSTVNAAIADAVWDEAVSGHVTADTFGERVLLSDGNNGNTVKVTPPGHIAADVHEFQTGVIEDADFAAGSVNDRLDTMLVADGAVYQYTANALELAPSGGGGGGGSTTVRMGPFEVRAEGQASDLPLDINKGATHGIDCVLVDAVGTGVDLTGATISTKVYNTAGTLVATITGTATYAAGGAMTWTIPTTVTNTAGTYTATITRTTGASDTEVFGPLRIYVRDI
jgi:hypothetical protein